MRGIQVNSQRFRGLRRARGLTQRQLASQAGVGERTIRNAESGHRVQLDFLSYLATALSAEVIDLVHDRDELHSVLREQRRVDRILAAFETYANGDQDELIGLMSPDVIYLMPGPPEIPICGEFRGADELRTLADRSAATIHYEAIPEITDIRTGGNLVVIRGIDRLRAIPTGKSFCTPWMNVYQFDAGRIVHAESWGDTSTTAQAFRPD